MLILADTHILLWAIFDSDKLSDNARYILTDPKNEIYYSAISVWELEIKHRLHPDKIGLDGKTFSCFCKEAGFHPISFSEKHACICESFEYPQNLPEHNDPFDKALLAQAKADGLNLMTHDKKLQNYNEACILRV